MKVRKSLMAAAATVALAMGATSAHAEFLDFTVNQGSIAGNTATALGLGIGSTTFTADKVTGFYEEVLTIDGLTGAFQTSAYAYMNAFSRNEATLPAIGSLAGTTYNVYAKFTSGGFFDGVSTFTGLTGGIELWLDPNANTLLSTGATGSDPIGVANGGDDYRLAFASVLEFATGNNVDPGSYKLIWTDFTLDELATPAGSAYFSSPDPFHMRIEVTGDFDQFNVVFDPVTNKATVRPTGDVSAVFLRIPEPGSLALVGLALAGLGFSTRRKQQA